MYKITGADGKEYGPISADQLRQWIAEGRVNAQTMVLAEGATQWQPLSQLPEFAASIPTTPPPGMAPMAAAAGVPSAAAQNMVNGPAIALMVLGILGLVLQVAGLIMNLAGASLWQGRQMEQTPFSGMMSGAGAVIGGALGIALSAVVLFGSIKMKKLENYGLAMAASIIVMLPCSLSVCCIIGLPFGIWSLVVLSKPEVKSAFH